ncbi:MAG: hypothetical protein JO131_05490 [Gammaproteobacteria bacterium]|nr:hypothetical protein [Gammaproteobacteria bacterium]
MLHINQIHDSIKNNLTKKIILGINILSLGGLPPFLGFLPKWLIIQNIIETK